MDETSMKRLVVIGAGAVGGCVAALVAKTGFPVKLITREEYVGHYIRNGLTVRFPDHQIHVALPVAGGTSEMDWRGGDVVVLATKLNDAKSLMDELREDAGADISVVCAFNGVAGEAWAIERFHTVLGMMIWMPSTHMTRGDFRVFGRECPGVLDIGLVKGDSGGSRSTAEELNELLVAASFDSVNRNDIMNWKHAKWVTNVGNTAQALVTDDWKRVATLARKEAEEVLTAAKVDRVATSELLDRCKNIQLAPIDGQRREGGSTWQSFERGKPLETPWIEGAIAQMGNELGVPVPINKKLLELSNVMQRVTADKIIAVAN